MNYRIFFLLIIVISLQSCKENKKEELTLISKSDKSILVKHKKFASLHESSVEKIDSWSAYKNFEDFLQRFEETSPNEAFGNAKELADLSKALKDSLTINNFKKPAFRARLNVLENEVLRLKDMADIPAITTKEVNLQIDKIFLVFGSLNEKINTSYSQEKFEKELDLDTFFKIDSIK